VPAALARYAVSVLALALVTTAACGRGTRDVSSFAGSTRCGSCHHEEHAAWAGSLHAAAAREARPGTVAAVFNGRRVEGRSVQATVRADGTALVFDVAERPHPYTADLVLGRAAVEQFLAPFPGGRWQAVPLAWDAVAREWFDVFPEAPDAGSWTHWTGPGATANAQCLDCHVTGYQKGFDAARNTYRTTWRELGVGCEACHGPGAAHAGGGAVDPAATRAPSDLACLPCHALRVPLAGASEPAADAGDRFDVELLESDAYWADGQLRGEAFEWTSFRMSRMAAAGVRCIDCHDPHAAALRAEGNALCLRCHAAELATPAHTHHRADGAGSACVGCHMPEHVFMERDRRRDHAFTRPDPRRSEAIGAPDACTDCHRDRDRAWAIARAAEWYGEGSEAARAQRAIATIVEAGRRGDPDAAAPLAQLLGSVLDDIRRASAARLLGAFADVPGVVTALRQAASDGSALVRASAVRGLADAPAADETRGTLVVGARDPVRLVRVEAAFSLRDVDVATLAAEDRVTVARAFDEWEAAQQVSADRPEVQMNRGIFWMARHDLPRAEAAYRAALALWPDDPAPRQNLALLLADSGRRGEAETELAELLRRTPDWPPALFALGTLRADAGRMPEAIPPLEACLRVDPGYPQAAYRLGLAYRATGDLAAAAHAFERGAAEPSSRGDALRELVRTHSQRGDQEAVARWLPDALLADRALADDPRVREIVAAMRAPASSP
jgi:predicted CXXCH cytochrome family protein